MARSLVRLVVPSPDGRRVLVRPNGLAGWTLPVVAVERADDAWSEALGDAAARLLGTSVAPVRLLRAGAWLVTAEGRVPAAGNTWIGVEEAERAGADAAVVRAWAAAPRDEAG